MGRRTGKERFHGGRIASCVVQEAKDAVSFLAGPPLHLQLNTLTESALQREIERMRKKYNKGKPFPRRKHPLRSGSLPD